MVVFNNQTVSRIEGAANGFLQRMIDCGSQSPIFRSLELKGESTVPLNKPQKSLCTPICHGLFPVKVCRFLVVIVLVIPSTSENTSLIFRCVSRPA
jgi:hypothetical protein